MSAIADEIRADPDAGRESLARHNLIVFTKRMFAGYQAVDHHWRIATALHEIEAGGLDRLIITMPPRHGKSELASVHFPSWFLGRNPDKRIIAASHSSTLAYHFSRRARNLMSDPAWPFAVTTAGDLANVQSWDIAGHRGGYYAAGVGGRIAGRGADVLMVDDAVGSAEEADSETYRERTWDWFTQDAVTRLEPDARIVLIGTRWHEDDLIGRALNGGETWEHVDLPALNDDGMALWPERFDAEALTRIKAQIGSRAFEALYQQRPSPAEGAILKREWWQSWRAPLPAIEWIVQGWDTAFKTGRENDYSVCVTIALSGGQFFVLDRWRERVEFPGLKRALRDQWTRWQPDEIIVEDAASGQSLIQELNQQNAPGALLMDHVVLPIVAFKPDRDKVARVNAISPYAEGARIFLPAEAGWREEFVEEAAAFPNATHDDQVDAFTMAMLRLIVRAEALRPIHPAVAAAWSDMAR